MAFRANANGAIEVGRKLAPSTQVSHDKSTLRLSPTAYRQVAECDDHRGICSTGGKSAGWRGAR